MSDNELEFRNGDLEPDWKMKAVLVGGVVGALVGVGAAYLYIRNIEEAGETPHVGTQDAMSIGVTLVALVKQIANLGNK
jgi:hypothetical protein